MDRTDLGRRRVTTEAWKSGPELTSAELHDLLRLRVDVFVVEQACAYPEIDGRDLLETTIHGWVTGSDGETIAAIRLLFDEEPMRIGRVVTRADHRGQRLAEALLQAAHQRGGATGSFLEAQSYLAEWYSRQGWTQCGDEFVEDGIPHIPMRRPPAAS